MNLPNPPAQAKIYVLLEPDTECIRYVGWTVKSLRERLRAHLRDKYACHKVNWIESLRRRGLTPKIRLVQVVDFTEWEEAERRWIAEYRVQGCALTNATDGGDGKLGCAHSERTKEKLRRAALRQFESAEARAAVSRMHKGKEISPEHRKIVGAAAKKRWEAWRAAGCITSEETRAKIRAAKTGRPSPNKGKPLSAEHIAKLSSARKGRVITPEWRAKISQSLKARAASRRA